MKSKGFTKMIKYFFLLTCLLGANFVSFSMDLKETEKIDASRILQHHIRNYNFQANKTKIFEDMYQKGIRFRDGKEGNLSEDSPLANSYAGAHFMPLALTGNVKAMHNFAFIKERQKDYEVAYDWYKHASDKRFEPSIRSFKRVRSLLKYNTLGIFPLEIWVKIISDLSHNSLISFRTSSFMAAVLVDEEFHKRGQIKTPLYCLAEKTKKHAFPYTISFCLRENMKQSLEVVCQINDQLLMSPMSLFSKKVDPGLLPQTPHVYDSCAIFCHDWHHPAKVLMRYMAQFGERETSPPTYYAVSEDIERMGFDLKNDLHSPDTQEFYLNFVSFYADSKPESIESFIKIAQNLIKLQRQEIACHFMVRAGIYLKNKANKYRNTAGIAIRGNNVVAMGMDANATSCFKIAAESGDVTAQKYLSATMPMNNS